MSTPPPDPQQPAAAGEPVAEPPSSSRPAGRVRAGTVPPLTSGAEEPGMISLFFGESVEQQAAVSEGTAVNFLRRLPLKKMLIWGVFLCLLYILRSFFGLILATFVLSYIASSLVERVQRLLRGRVGRTPLVVAFYLLLLLALTGVGWMLIPRIAQEGRALLHTMQSSLVEAGERVPAAGHAAGHEPAGEVHAPATGETGSPLVREWWLATLSNLLGAQLFEEWRSSWLSDEVLAQALSLLRGTWSAVFEGMQRMVRTAVGGILQFFAALIFSFLIVVDIPRLGRALRSLEHSRLRGAYHEVAPSVARFSHLLGQAFQAQTIIALVNTLLTAGGMTLLGIRPIGFLSLIVFLCSYIPVAGVFLSTIPMGLVALKLGGLEKVLLVIAMVSGVHLVEAYILNPRIYSMHMKLHPLAVLVILYVAEHLIGVWGLVISVPLAVFVYRTLILTDDKAPA